LYGIVVGYTWRGFLGIKQTQQEYHAACATEATHASSSAVEDGGFVDEGKRERVEMLGARNRSREALGYRGV